MATPGSLHRAQRRFAFSVMTPIMIYLMVFQFASDDLGSHSRFF
jgi:hypothetical protein